MQLPFLDPFPPITQVVQQPVRIKTKSYNDIHQIQFAMWASELLLSESIPGTQLCKNNPYLVVCGGDLDTQQAHVQCPLVISGKPSLELLTEFDGNKRANTMEPKIQYGICYHELCSG